MTESCKFVRTKEEEEPSTQGMATVFGDALETRAVVIYGTSPGVCSQPGLPTLLSRGGSPVPAPTRPSSQGQEACVEMEARTYPGEHAARPG